jgi:hypothetical protein
MKPVLEKLGLKQGLSGWTYHCPDDLAAVVPLPSTAPAEAPDVTIAFVRSVSEVVPALAAVLRAYARGKALWFAYPKKTGAIRTDISRDTGWEPLAEAGLLPVTLVSLNETWSALRFRYRDEIKSLKRKRDYPGQRD